MGARPTLSVIIPTYNRADLLPKTLGSVFDQTFTDLEIIVVDDGSTDRTEEAVARLVEEKPLAGERIRYFFQSNQGKSAALNKGLSEVRGEWIAFLDSDDLWLPNKIEEQFKALQHYKAQSQACFTNGVFINNPYVQGSLFERAGRRCEGKTGILDDPMEVIDKFWVSMVTVLMHSRLMDKVGEFDPSFWSGQDEDFLFRLSLHTALCYVNSPLALIDRRPRCPGRLTEIKYRREYEALTLRQRRCEKWLRLTEQRGGRIHAALRGRLRGIHSERANWLLVNKRYREARRAAALAARTEYSLGIVAKWCLATVAPPLARRMVIRRSRRDHKRDLHIAQLLGTVPDGVSAPLPGRSS